MELIVNVSSLYPIDLTAALARLVSEKRADLLVAINDGARVKGKAEHRVHIARQAIATCQWDYGTDGTWRLKHEPMENDDGDRTIEALATLTGDIEHSVGTHSATLAGEVRNRANQVVDAIVSNTDTPPKAWIGSTAAIVRHVFASCGYPNVTTCRYSDIFEDLRARGVVAQFLARLIQESSSARRRISFLRGGYIEINDNGRLRRFRELESILSASTELLLLSDDGGTVQLSIHEAIEDPLLRIGGPLELGLLAVSFEFVDFPWFTYGSIVGTSDHREYISPPIVVQDSRAGSRWGGGERLSPAGYSLLDFGNEPGVRALIAGLLGSELPDVESLSTWAELLERIPPARQKAAKSQSIAHALRHELESEATSILWQGSLRSNIAWTAGRRSPFTLSSEAISILAIMHCLRRASFMRGESIPSGARQFLIELGLISGNRVNVDRFNAIVSTALDSSLYWLSNWGISSKDCGTLRETCGRLMTEQLEKAWVLDEGPRSGMGQLTKAFQRVTDAYLEFVVFFGTSVVKSHILLLYLLLGPKTLLRALGDLELRRAAPYLGFQPLVYELI